MGFARREGAQGFRPAAHRLYTNKVPPSVRWNILVHLAFAWIPNNFIGVAIRNDGNCTVEPVIEEHKLLFGLGGECKDMIEGLVAS